MDFHSDVKYCSSLVSHVAFPSLSSLGREKPHACPSIDEIYYFISYSELTALLNMHNTRTTRTKHLFSELLGGYRL